MFVTQFSNIIPITIMGRKGLLHGSIVSNVFVLVLEGDSVHHYVRVCLLNGQATS